MLVNNYKRPKSTISLLASRETGCNNNFSFSSELLDIKTKNLHIASFYFVNYYPGCIDTECKLIRKGCNDTHILGIWSGSGYQCHGYISKLETIFRQKCSKKKVQCLVEEIKVAGTHCALFPVQDACLASLRGRDHLMYVEKSWGSKKSSVLFTTFEEESVHLRYGIKSDLSSCTYNQVKEIFAIGAAQNIYIYDPHQLSFRALCGDAIAVEFDQSGNVLYTGGAVYGWKIHDMRMPFDESSQISSPNVGVSELKLITDENTILLSKLDGHLSKVDLRTKRTLVTYPGNINQIGRKLPFSFDEKGDILCATGSDFTTRLWSLTSGKALHSLQPFVPNEPSSSCLVSSENQWCVALFDNASSSLMEL